MTGLVTPGSEISRVHAPRFVPRHHHIAPYAAIVLRGCYVEAGDRGRFLAEPGAVLLHDGFEAHQDAFGRRGAEILNLPLDRPPAASFGRIDDPDTLVRAARRDRREALALLADALRAEESGLDDWPDRLAAALRGNNVASLGAWGRAHGLTPSSVSRGFRLCYGVSPQRYRLEQRARHAAAAARQAKSRPLAVIALDAGFADQAHMSRTLRRLYGRTPTALRRDKCVQDRSAAGP
jgi:AraC-like DNA-binding protein